MSPRSLALVAFFLIFSAACDQPTPGIDQDPTAAVSVTVALTASEVGAATLQYFLDHPSVLPAPITGAVGVADPATTFQLTQLPVATGYLLQLLAYKPGDTQLFARAKPPSTSKTA